MIDLDYQNSDYFRFRYENNEYDEFLLVIFGSIFILNNSFENFIFHEIRLILIFLLFDFSSEY